MTECLQFHEIANLFPLMDGAALDELKQDIAKHGVLQPIMLLEGAILDGRNRYLCARDLGISYALDEYSGDDPLAYVISHNLHRRHLSESQRAMVAAQLANMKRGDNQHPQICRPSTPPVSNADAASMLNVSPRSVETAKKVQGRGAPELVDAVRQGMVSVSAAGDIAELPASEQAEIVARGESEILAAAKQIREDRAAAKRKNNEALRAKKSPAPSGFFDVVVIDPPWPVDKISRDVRPNQTELDYPTMAEEELAEMVIPCADACHVWVWTTHKLLPMAFRLLNAWDLRYICTFTWHKPGGFQPFGLPQYNCEFALYCRRGTPVFVDTKAFSTCFCAPRGAHSEKPDEFYNMVRRTTKGRRLDMFNRRSIAGFEVWGNQSNALAK